MNLRDAQPTIIHVDEDIIRAHLGVQELIPRPSVTLRACYAVPKASGSRVALSELRQNGEATTNGGESEGKSGWLIGEMLEKQEKEGGFEGQWEVRWPFRSSKKADDWEGREFVLSHLLSLLQIKIPSNTSPLLLVPPPTPTFSLDEQALYCQLAFETLNTPGFSILPLPLASLFAVNSTTGIVLHVGWTKSQIHIVVDSVVRWECSSSVEIGLEDCERWFEDLLASDPHLGFQLDSHVGEDQSRRKKLLKEVAEVVWKECTGDDIDIPLAGVGVSNVIVVQKPQEEEVDFDVAKKLVGEPVPAPTAPSHKSKKQQAAATKAASDAAAAEAAQAADLITIQIPSLPSVDITLGTVRNRLCEPLFKGKQTGGDTIWEALGRAIESESLSIAERMSVWEGVVVVGEVAQIKSFSPALMTYLSPYLLSSADVPSDVQPAHARLLSIPDYFTNFKGSTTDLAPFLGGSMVAKVAFSDSAGKHHITKVDYNAKGPAAIYAVVNEDN